MAIPNGSAEEHDIYRSLVVDEYGELDWRAYLRSRSRADDGRDPVGAPVETDGGQLQEPEFPELHVGDHVQDREDENGATMIVVGLPPETTGEYTVDGTPLIEYDEEYPASDDVVEVVYPQRTDVDVSENRYAFPRSRLRLAHAIHDRDADEQR